MKGSTTQKARGRSTSQFLTQPRLLQLSVLLAAWPGIAWADTIVPGGSVSGHWDLAGSPYLVQSDINVPFDAELVVDPGVTVKFQKGTKLEVAGRIQATGTPTNRISFTSAALPRGIWDWRGISVVAGGPRSLFESVDIEFAGTGLAISGHHPQATLAKSEVHHCGSNGVQIFARAGETVGPADVILDTNSIHNNGWGIYAEAYAGNLGSTVEPTIKGNEIYSNSYGIVLRANGAAYTSGYAYAKGQIQLNTVRDNTTGIATAELQTKCDAKGTFTNNLVINNIGNGFNLNGIGSVLINNTVLGNGGAGIFHRAWALGTARNNIVVSNRRGIQSESAYTPSAGQVSCNNVALNTEANWSNYPAAYGSLTTTNLNGTPADAQGNISVDPQFADPDKGNFHLRSQAGRYDPISETWILDASTSPCIDAGHPDSVWVDEPSPNGERVDMGSHGATPYASKSYHEFRIFVISRTSDNAVVLSWGCLPSHTYTVLHSDSLDEWLEDLPGSQRSSNENQTLLHFTHPSGAMNPRQFYRVRWDSK
jgi:hypothetical protein